MQIGQNITLSDKFSNYDEIYFDPYYNVSSVLQSTTRAGGSIYLSALFAGASDTNRQYLSVSGVTQGTPEFCDLYYDGNVTLYAGATQALWVGKIIGRRYTKVSPTGYRQVTLYDNAELSPVVDNQVIDLTQNVETFDELVFEIAFGTSGQMYYRDETKHISLLGIGTNKKLVVGMTKNATSNVYVTLSFETSSKIFIVGSSTAPVVLTKIIGIKY
jgi:hypothetical protein